MRQILGGMMSCWWNDFEVGSDRSRVEAGRLRRLYGFRGSI